MMDSVMISIAVVIATVGYGIIWLAIDSSNVMAGVVGGALLGAGVATGLLGR